MFGGAGGGLGFGSPMDVSSAPAGLPSEHRHACRAPHRCHAAPPRGAWRLPPCHLPARAHWRAHVRSCADDGQPGGHVRHDEQPHDAVADEQPRAAAQHAHQQPRHPAGRCARRRGAATQRKATQRGKSLSPHLAAIHTRAARQHGRAQRAWPCALRALPDVRAPRCVRCVRCVCRAAAQLIQRNPEIGAMLTDPQLLRQSMQIASNPVRRRATHTQPRASTLPPWRPASRSRSAWRPGCSASAPSVAPHALCAVRRRL